MLATAVAVLVSSCGPSNPTTTEEISSAVVERVIDGDTVDLTIGGRSERTRLIGVDAPESVSPSVPVQCFGAEASGALADLLPAGTVVDIYRDVEARDRYGRLLLYLYRADDHLFVNHWLVDLGYADAISYEPNTAHEADFSVARREAEAGGIGLWQHCDGPDQPLS